MTLARDEFLAEEAQAKLRLVQLLPEWDRSTWIALTLLILAALFFEGAFRLLRRSELARERLLQSDGIQRTALYRALAITLHPQTGSFSPEAKLTSLATQFGIACEAAALRDPEAYAMAVALADWYEQAARRYHGTSSAYFAVVTEIATKLKLLEDHFGRRRDAFSNSSGSAK